MKKLLNIRLLLLLLSILFTSMSCEKDDQGNRVTFYKTIGEGYIFERDDNKPIEGVKIVVTSSTSSVESGIVILFSSPYTEETFTTDKNGYYQIRFAKRVGGDKVERYKIRLDHFSALFYPPPPALFWNWETSSNNAPFTSNDNLYPSYVKNKKIITFDTVKYYYNKNE